MLLMGEDAWISVLQLTWTQSCQQDNHPFPGQLVPQDSTYVPAAYHHWERLNSSP